MIRITCAGCDGQFDVNDTIFYRKKRWCQSDNCKKVIDEKIKHRNYKRQQNKIKNGTWRKGVPVQLKAVVMERDNDCCVECLSNKANTLQIHHIIPVSQGGADDLSNLITLCKHCHDLVHRKGFQKYVSKFNAKTLE